MFRSQKRCEIIALESKTFWRPVTREHDLRRRRQSRQTQRSRTKRHQDFLPGKPFPAHGVAGRSQRHAADPGNLPHSTAAFARRNRSSRNSRPDRPGAKLIGDLDKAKAEVIVDVAVLQINRDKSKTLGINPPTSATVALQSNLNPTTTTTTTATTGSGTIGNLEFNHRHAQSAQPQPD